MSISMYLFSLQRLPCWLSPHVLRFVFEKWLQLSVVWGPGEFVFFSCGGGGAFFLIEGDQGKVSEMETYEIKG